MSSFKKLSKADVTTVDYSANKQWNLLYTSSIPSNSEITVYKGRNVSFNINGATTVNGQYRSSIYSSMNHLFYQSYTASLNTGSIMMNPDTYMSASQQRPTASYFDYNSNPLFINQFPTGANDDIAVLKINQNIYGSKVLPNSFKMSSSLFSIRDDGNGNLYDIAGVGDDYIDLNYLTIAFVNGYFDDLTPAISTSLVGNIFYAHGIATFTNPLYTSLFPSSSDCLSYSLSVNRGGTTTTYYYTDCYNLPVTTSVLSDNALVICASSAYPITIVPGGTGTATLDGPCTYGAIYNLSSSVMVSFQNEHIIYENEVRCIVRESDYNLSYNPTLVTGSYASGSLRDFVTGSFFQPYVTTIGLYNDENELLMVAKLGKPIALSSDTDMTFIVRYDT
jgi:hypothetical protein